MNEHLTGSIKQEHFNEQYYTEHYDRAPAGMVQYRRISDAQHMNNLREMAGNLKARYPWIRKALVLGCGRGELVLAFKELGVNALGVDHSSYAVNNLVAGLNRGDVVHGDIAQLSFARDREYDIVLALDIFNCIRQPTLDSALREASRVAKLLVVDMPVNPDDTTPDMSSIHGNFDVSIYSQEYWLNKFTDLGMLYSRGQQYVYPETREGSRWEDGRIYAYSMFFEAPYIHPNKSNIPKLSIPEDAKDFKILWWANAPHTPTGYGVGTEQVVFKAEDYYTMAVLCNYGLEGGSLRMGAQNGRYKTAPIMYPKLFEPSGGDAASLICLNWKPDIAVTLFDVWVGEGNNPYSPRPSGWIKQMLPYWIAYVPIDHDPIPFAILNQCRQADRVVAMSRFGQKQLEKEEVGSHYIPHGCYTNTFKNLGDKEQWKENLQLRGTPLDNDNSEDWSSEDFIIGINAANKDTKRKGYEPMFRAFNHFLVNNPDARKDAKLYLHTWQDFPGGLPLFQLANSLNVEPYIRCTHKWYMYNSLNLDRMAELYNGFDVFMNCSRNEGFGIPIIEAQSCEVPVIATDFTSMTELVGDDGWLVNPITHEIDMLMSNTAVPNHYEIAEYLEKAYNNPDALKKMGKKARKKIVNRYDVETVIQPLWLDLFEDVRKELSLRKLDTTDEGDWIE